MKIESKKPEPQFNPITITLETREEALAMYASLISATRHALKHSVSNTKVDLMHAFKLHFEPNSTSEIYL